MMCKGMMEQKMLLEFAVPILVPIDKLSESSFANARTSGEYRNQIRWEAV